MSEIHQGTVNVRITGPLIPIEQSIRNEKKSECTRHWDFAYRPRRACNRFCPYTSAEFQSEKEMFIQSQVCFEKARIPPVLLKVRA